MRFENHQTDISSDKKDSHVEVEKDSHLLTTEGSTGH